MAVRKRIRWTAKLIALHGGIIHNNKFDYSNINDNGNIKAMTSIPIKCNTCSYEFTQTINDHINNKQGCASCSKVLKYNYENLVTRARKIHGDKYDYSLAEELPKITALTSIMIKCNVCNHTFPQVVNDHINDACGCTKCSGHWRYNYENLIIRAREVHGDKYDYSASANLPLIESSMRILIKCNICDYKFLQFVDHHINKSCGCPKCKMSKGEILVDKYLTNGDFEFEIQYILPTLSRKKFDFAIHDYKYIIEYDGVQHFDYNDFFHGNIDGYNYQLSKDVDKSIEALKQGYTLIRISYDMNDYDAISNYLDYVFNTNKQFYVSHNTLYDEHIKKVMEIIPDVSEKICVGYE